MIEKQDLFTRAREAAARVKELRGEILVRRIELKKALVDARSLKSQVMQQLAGVRKPRRTKIHSHTPICWSPGCGRPSVKLVSDIEGASWECCAEHEVAAGSRKEKNADA